MTAGYLIKFYVVGKIKCLFNYYRPFTTLLIDRETDIFSISEAIPLNSKQK